MTTCIRNLGNLHGMITRIYLNESTENDLWNDINVLNLTWDLVTRPSTVTRGMCLTFQNVSICITTSEILASPLRSLILSKQVQHDTLWGLLSSTCIFIPPYTLTANNSTVHRISTKKAIAAQPSHSCLFDDTVVCQDSSCAIIIHKMAPQ